MTCVVRVPITVLWVPLYALMICVEALKSNGENLKAMAITNGHTFTVEPLSNKTDDTRWPEQATSMNKGRTWSDPSGSKSSSENTMHVALSAIRKWISPLGVIAVSTLIWLKALIKASLCVLDKAKRLQMDMRACVVSNWCNISSSSFWTSSLVFVPAKGLLICGSLVYQLIHIQLVLLGWGSNQQNL